jgi:hypothetical protein
MEESSHYVSEGVLRGIDHVSDSKDMPRRTIRLVSRIACGEHGYMNEDARGQDLS